jgi:hypothetical protein
MNEENVSGIFPVVHVRLIRETGIGGTSGIPLAAPEVVHAFRLLAALSNALTAALKPKKRCKSLEERILEIKLTLVTKRNPLKIKEFDSTVGKSQVKSN